MQKVTAIVGRNGSGKTLYIDQLRKQLASDRVRYIAFTDSYGVNVDGQYYLQLRWNQHDIDHETPTVGELLEKAYKLAGEDTEERRKLQAHLYKLFHMEEFLDKYIIILSSGELRKFQLTKTLFANPKLLIMDNPFIGLDAETRDQLKELLSVLTTVFLTALNVPYSALMCNMTQDNYEHSLLGIFSMFGVVLGHLIINSTVDKITSAAATPAQGWRNAGLVYAIISIVLVLICFFGTKERWAETTSKESAEEKKLSLVDKGKLLLKNKYWVKMFVFAFLGLLTNAVISNSGLYFCKAVWGNTANYSVLSNALTLCQMISMLLVFILIKKLGKVKVALIGTIGTVAACVLQAIVPHSLGVGIVCMAAKGLFFAFPSGCMFGLVADTIDYGEWQSGVKLPGVGMSVMAFGEKVAKGLGSVLIGFIVGSTSTAAAEVEQATVSVAQANLCFNILPAVLLGITIFVLFSYDYDKIAPQINEELKARRQSAE